jgi:23S rRNA (cytosine1962-C5)-methyltransferase
MSLPQLILKSKSDRRLKLGHLWVFSNEVDIKRSPLKNFSMGEQAVVTTHNGKPLGVAFMNPNGLICGRMVSRDENSPLNKSLFVQRCKQSLALRELAFSEPYYRLIYG